MNVLLQTIAFLSFMYVIVDVNGHGYLMDPPARSTAWRYGFDTPPNYTDNELNCGGFANQWQTHDGKCGVCGDPYQQNPRENEAGGLYATGTIVENYYTGSQITVTIKITANHQGWVLFRLCKNDDVNKAITEECLDEHHLVEVGTDLTIIPLPGVENKDYSFLLQLPEGLTCSQCVLQWKWNAGNSWGVDPQTGEGCTGCGPQEQFYGCADISIEGSEMDSTSSSTQSTTQATTPSSDGTTTKPTTLTPTTQSSDGTTTRKSTTQATTSPSDGTTTSKSTTEGTTAQATTSQPNGDDASNCHAVKPYDADPSMDEWCVSNCALNNCPASHCTCDDGEQQGNDIIKLDCETANGQWSRIPGLKTWCNQNCNHVPSYCPATHCTCTPIFK